MIAELEIDRVRGTVLCLDVLRERGIEVRRAGENWIALCPFHKERTASLTLYPNNSWWCFGCGSHGDVIALVMLLDGLGFVETLRRLGASETPGSPSWRKPAKPSREARLASAAEERLADILSVNACDPEADFFHESPIRLEWPHSKDAAHFLEIFRPGSIIWTGELYDSGKPHHAKHFQPVEQVIANGLMGSRVTPGVYKKGSFSRSQEQLAGPAPFIVIECDDLLGRKPETAEERMMNQAYNGALLRWFRDQSNLRLAAIVDTGNRSLHGWVRRPPDNALRHLTAILKAFHIDRAALNGAQPFRLPGFPHEKTGVTSKLLYLDSLQ